MGGDREGLLSVSNSYTPDNPKIIGRPRSPFPRCLAADKSRRRDMAETDPKSVQDLTNVVSRGRDRELALAAVA